MATQPGSPSWSPRSWPAPCKRANRKDLVKLKSILESHSAAAEGSTTGCVSPKFSDHLIEGARRWRNRPRPTCTAEPPPTRSPSPKGCDPTSSTCPTPCSAWTVQDLLDHLAGGTEYLVAASSGTEPAAPTGTTAGGLRAGVAAVPGGFGRAGRAGPDMHVAARVRVAGRPSRRRHVHGRADPHLRPGPRHRAGRADLDPDLVEACMAMFLPDMPERGRAAGIVGPAVRSADDATRRTGCWRRWAARRERAGAGGGDPRPSRTRAGGPCCAWSGTTSGPPPSSPRQPGCRSRRPASTSSSCARPGWCRSGSTPPGASTGPTSRGWRRWPGSSTTSGRHLERLKATAEARTGRAATEGTAAMKLAVQELVVHAPVEQLFELLVDPELFVLWMADDATLDPVPAGPCAGPTPTATPARALTSRSSGPPGRVHLRLGARRGADPAGVDHRRDRPHRPARRATHLRLVHRGLADRAADAHQGGWGHYLDRLRRTAEGEHPARIRGPTGVCRPPRSSPR